MYRPGFGVVTSVAVVLCAAAFFSLLMAPRIPKVPMNEMKYSSDDFLRQARYEPIQWMPFGRAALLRARELGSPILLMICAPTSNVALRLDETTFNDSEVAAYLHRHFVCARIDGAVYPEWLNAMRPISRLKAPFRPDFQIWVLDPGGREFDLIQRTEGDENLTPSVFLPRLVELYGKFRVQRDTDFLLSGLGQRLDLRLIQRRAIRTLGDLRSLSGDLARSLAAFSTFLRTLGASSHCGFPIDGLLGLTPEAWRYLVLSGDKRTFETAIREGVLRSPMTDLVDGGMFHTVVLRGSEVVEFDKQTVENAEAMVALAEEGQIDHDPFDRYFARQVWRYLESSYRFNDGFAMGQLGESTERMRSKRYSVSAQRLRQSLPADLQSWAVQNLGLDPARMPQAIPYLTANANVDSRFEQAIDGIRRTAISQPKTVDLGLTDVSFSCVARAIEVARIWQDPVFISESLRWLASVDSLAAGSGVKRGFGRLQSSNGYLGDYLAYADAALQAYLATGDPGRLRPGLRILNQAIRHFHSPTPGVWVLNDPLEAMLIPNCSVPEIADNLHESCTAKMVRLLLGYGRILGPTREGRSFTTAAVETVVKMLPLAETGNPLSAGFFCAAREIYDPAFAVTVGPNALALANSLYSAVPTRLVFPATGSVRPDLQARKPGIYVIRAKIEGPFATVAAAEKALPPIFAISNNPPPPARPIPAQP